MCLGFLKIQISAQACSYNHSFFTLKKVSCFKKKISVIPNTFTVVRY